MKPQTSPHHHRIKSDQPLNFDKLQQGSCLSADRLCDSEEKSSFDACLSCGKPLPQDVCQINIDNHQSLIPNMCARNPLSTTHDAYRRFDKQDELKTLLIYPAGKPSDVGIYENNEKRSLLLNNYFQLDGYTSTHKTVKRNLNSSMSNILAYDEAGFSSHNRSSQPPLEAQNQMNRRKNTRSTVSLSIKPGEISVLEGHGHSFELSASKWQRVQIKDMIINRKQSRLEKESSKNNADQNDSLDDNTQTHNSSNQFSTISALTMVASQRNYSLSPSVHSAEKAEKMSGGSIGFKSPIPSIPNQFFKGTTILRGGAEKKADLKPNFSAFHFLSNSYSAKKAKAFANISKQSPKKNAHSGKNHTILGEGNSSYVSQLNKSRQKSFTDLISKKNRDASLQIKSSSYMFSPIQYNSNLKTEGNEYNNVKKIQRSQIYTRVNALHPERDIISSKKFSLNESRTTQANSSFSEQKHLSEHLAKDLTKEVETNNPLISDVNGGYLTPNIASKNSKATRGLGNISITQNVPAAVDTKELQLNMDGLENENNLSFECNSERSNFSFGEKSSHKEDAIHNRTFTTHSSNPYKLIISETIGNKSFSANSEKKMQNRTEQLNSYFKTYMLKAEKKRQCTESPNKMRPKELKFWEKTSNTGISHARTTSGSKRLEEEVKNLIESSNQIKQIKDISKTNKVRKEIQTNGLLKF